MTTHRTHVTHSSVARRRRRPNPGLELFAPPPNARTAAPMDDVEQAEQLVADLLALVDFGVVTPLSDPGGRARYAITEGANPHD